MSWSLALAALCWFLGPIRAGWLIWRAVSTDEAPLQGQVYIEPRRPALAQLVAAEQRLGRLS